MNREKMKDLIREMEHLLEKEKEFVRELEKVTHQAKEMERVFMEE